MAVKVFKVKYKKKKSQKVSAPVTRTRVQERRRQGNHPTAPTVRCSWHMLFCLKLQEAAQEKQVFNMDAKLYNLNFTLQPPRIILLFFIFLICHNYCHVAHTALLQGLAVLLAALLFYFLFCTLFSGEHRDAAGVIVVQLCFMCDCQFVM